MSLIISEKNKINESIRIIRKNIEHSNDTIKRFKSQSASDFIINQIEKLTKSNIEDEIQIEILEKRLLDLESGILNEELLLEKKQNKDIAESKNSVNKKKKEAEIKVQDEKKKKSKDLDSNNRDYERKERSKEYNMNRAYSYYQKSVESIPDYMLDNLENMPNNKGYIWRDIYCYGDLPPEENRPITLFEKQRDLMIIHEWSNKYYTIYHKVGKAGRKSIVNRTEIKRSNFSSDSLSSFIDNNIAEPIVTNDVDTPIVDKPREQPPFINKTSYDKSRGQHQGEQYQEKPQGQPREQQPRGQNQGQPREQQPRGQNQEKPQGQHQEKTQGQPREQQPRGQYQGGQQPRGQQPRGQNQGGQNQGGQNQGGQQPRGQHQEKPQGQPRGQNQGGQPREQQPREQQPREQYQEKPQGQPRGQNQEKTQGQPRGQNQGQPREQQGRGRPKK